MPKFELQENQIFGDTNLVLGKFSTTPTGTTFKCKLQNKQVFLACDVYKFLGLSNNLNNLNFKRTQKATAANTINTNDQFVINLKDQKISSTITKTDKKLLKLLFKQQKTKLYNSLLKHH